VRPERHNFPDKNWQIPLTCEQFNPRRNQRQLTLSYQLLPLKRRKAAQNATADRPSLPEKPPFATGNGNAERCATTQRTK
jgi:hypothetical protein